MGDNVPANDVAARYVCETLDPDEETLTPEEIRGRYVKQARLTITTS